MRALLILVVVIMVGAIGCDRQPPVPFGEREALAALERVKRGNDLGAEYDFAVILHIGTILNDPQSASELTPETKGQCLSVLRTAVDRYSDSPNRSNVYAKDALDRYYAGK